MIEDESGVGAGEPGEARSLVLISALNHFCFCPRRFAYIHIEHLFEENVHTMRGRREHEAVDRSSGAALGDGGREETGLPVWSQRLGLVGRCDLVEFRSDGTIYPVERKHGARRPWDNDDAQLCAQALCLEEMFGCFVPEGAVYHVSSRRRRVVRFTTELRARIDGLLAEIRDLFRAGFLPPPVNDRRCEGCSLREVCQPSAPRRTAAPFLFEPLPEPAALPP